ncbi:GH12 family glycosyl hydrolase domain-containing protein [Saccharothrix stipae]
MLKRFMVTVLAAAALVLPTTGTAQAAGSCEDFYSITMGKYWVNNNVWGQNSGQGWQCVWDVSSGGSIAWGTSWNWSGGPGQVKSYASSVLGWHWGNKLSGTGLPVRLSDNRSVNTGASYTVRQNTANVMNVAYDLWLHPTANPGTANPSDEIMIWTYRAGGAGPVGTRQATVSIAGATWDLYRGNIGWEVYSFIRTSNTNSATFNLRDFTSHLSSRGWLSNQKYLTSVQHGTEVFSGNGQLDVHSYYANVG